MNESLMRKCIDMAREAAGQGQYALASLVAKGDDVIASQGSTLSAGNDPTAHPELVAIRKAAESTGSRYLPGTVLFSTLEPCPMCTAAAIWAKMDGIIFGASQEDAIEWAQEDPCSPYSWRQINLKCEKVVSAGNPLLWVQGNVLGDECRELFLLSKVKGV